MQLSKKVQFLLTAFLLVIFGAISFSKINLHIIDLGRHLKNGEIILKTLKVSQSNLYSYTYPDFPFINHHWGSGVIFYIIHSLAGFNGLTLFYVLLSSLTLYIFFCVARAKSDFFVALLVALFFMPIVSMRTDVRPEVFSYLFSGLFLLILTKYKDKKISKKWLYTVPLIHLFWINLHIYFFLGFFILAVFWIQEVFGSFINKSGNNNSSFNNKIAEDIFTISVLSFLATFINPAGIRGVLLPLNIFNNYAYPVLENQSVVFLERIQPTASIIFFKISFYITSLSFIFLIIKRKRPEVSLVLFFLFFSYISWTAVRNVALFGYFALVITSSNIKFLVGERFKNSDKNILLFFVASLSVLIILINFSVNPSFWLNSFKYQIGIGVRKEVRAAIDFVKKEKLSGPIFNNYDIGSYLIYFLYPQEKVFVDNRPEAYPSKFFEEVYIPMQEKEDVWEKVDEVYNFNMIFFNRHDYTNWGQTFLINRTKDSRWAPVWVDDFTIIFLKRNEKNKEVIGKYELPKDMFTVR